MWFSCCWLRVFWFPGWFSYVLSMPFKLASIVLACQTTLILSWFALFLSLLCLSSVLLSVFLWALVSKNSHLKLICFVSVSSVLFLSSCGPWCQKNSHLKLICFVSVSSVLFLSSCGPWCQKTLILSWFALFLSLLCSFCLLVGLGVKKLSS